ncbi:MAG: sulfatase-like hydrolase/transferase [Roseibacillus sp.]|nr:sulfatase-like hydrolase/transferase [Roseibacillus sp.]
MRILPAALFLLVAVIPCHAQKPNIVLVMADDMGWGQTGYYDHPVLKTPNLDAMAANGLRFDRFYAGGPVCSPTRATVLTGRTHDRGGVQNHGFALRKQEKTLAVALRSAGYATGHFGKWHLNGLRGPGVPILKGDTHGPGGFGFDEWLSVTNFFDKNPVMSRKGSFEEFKGDSSEIIVTEALKFISAQAGAGKPSFTVIWYGTPHSPWMGLEGDLALFPGLKGKSQHHYAELAAMDRSIGSLRSGLRRLGIAKDTLVWFCSDNGGLPGFKPDTVGGLRGYKGSLFEGGLRVPAAIEWPAGIPQPRVTSYPAATMDIFPTLAEIVGLPASVMLQPQDGESLRSLFGKERGRRGKPLGFRNSGRGALIDNEFKLYIRNVGEGGFQLYHLGKDPAEKRDVTARYPGVAKRLRKVFEEWNASVQASVDGKDYPSGTVDAPQPPRMFWTDLDAYRPYFREWRSRPEYQGRLKGKK